MQGLDDGISARPNLLTSIASLRVTRELNNLLIPVYIYKLKTDTDK